MKKILLSALCLLGMNQVFGQNLVVHYEMDDMTSTSLPANNLSIYGTGTTPTWAQGVTGNVSDDCAQFYNGQGYISSTPINNASWSGVSMSIWYNSLSNYQGSMIQGAYLGFGMRMLTSGQVQASFDGSAAGSYNSTFSINDGNWHHIVAQNNNGFTEIYIDGVLNVSGAEPMYTLPSPNAGAVFYFGAAFGNLASEKIYGKLDEIKIYDNILTQAQIDALFAYQGCIVNVPDVAFKTYLLSNPTINTNSDGQIQCTEAAAYSGTINCSNLGIADLTGLEAFTAVTNINCSLNDISAIDISQNSNLLYLNAQDNYISNFTKGANTALASLYLGSNELTAVDLSNLPSLYSASVMNNLLSYITVFNCPNLVDLYVSGNNLNDIDLGTNPAIQSLYLASNNFTTFDCSSLSNLFELRINDNNLTSLNVANGNNSNMTNAYFNAQYNSGLSCIEVDDVAYSTSTWTNINSGVSFSLDCGNILATSMTIVGSGGATTISTPLGSLQMQRIILPANTTNQDVTWSITSGNTLASINSIGYISAIANGVITVSATTLDGSNITASANITISNQASGINENELNAINIYPNPSNSIINIDSPIAVQKVTIVDMNGKQIREENTASFMINDLEQGIYFLHIETEKGSSTRKLIRE